MSAIINLKKAIYNKMYDVIDSHVSNPNKHLIREEDGEPDTPPMIALSASSRPRSNGNSLTGIHDVRIVETFQNPFDVEYGREKTLSLDVTISDIDGDRADTLHSEIQNAFEYDGRFRDSQELIQWSTFPMSFKDDIIPIDEVRVADTSPIDRDQRVGHTLSIDVDYLRTFKYSDVSDPPSSVTEVVSQLENKTITTYDTSVSLSE